MDIDKIVKIENLAEKAGGRFKLSILLQKRVKELVKGARPLVDLKGESFIDIALEEFAQDKISLGLINEVKKGKKR